MAFDTPETDTLTDADPISVDDAVNLLSADDDDLAPDAAADAAPEPPNAADDQAADADDAPDDDDPASEDGEDDDGDDQEDPASAIDPPEFWSAEEKALFAKAPPDVQLLIAAKDAAAEKRVYAAKEEAATARKEASVIAEVKALIDQQLERAQGIFQGKWDGVDWALWAKENPTEAFQAKIEFDQEQEELAKLQTARAATEVEEHRQFLRAENAKLVESGHILADPEKGKAEKVALITYAEANGFSREDLKWAGAKELQTLHKAMLYDKAQASLATKPNKQPTLEAKRPGPVRPAGPPPTRRETQQKRRQALVGRAFATGKVDDAVALLNALED